MSDYYKIYDPNSWNIKPRYEIGDLLFNFELEVVAYLIERRFIGIKNYSRRDVKEMLNNKPPHMETWYYRFKCLSKKDPLFKEWKSEYQVFNIIKTGMWKYRTRNKDV